MVRAAWLDTLAIKIWVWMVDKPLESYIYQTCDVILAVEAAPTPPFRGFVAQILNTRLQRLGPTLPDWKDPGREAQWQTGITQHLGLGLDLLHTLERQLVICTHS